MISLSLDTWLNFNNDLSTVPRNWLIQSKLWHQILVGQKLGHDDNSASAHSLDTTGYSTYTTVNGQNYYSNGEYSSYSMGAWERTWNGMMIRSTELEYQLINGQQVTGVFLESGEFIQGKYFEIFHSR